MKNELLTEDALSLDKIEGEVLEAYNEELGTEEPFILMENKRVSLEQIKKEIASRVGWKISIQFH